MHPMNEVQGANCQVRGQEGDAETAGASIPQAGREIPESEQLSDISDRHESEQHADNERLISLGIALARALQRQASETDAERPTQM